MSKIEYKIDIPLFTEEASEIWSNMPTIISGLVAKKQDAIDKFNRLDTLVNGGTLKQVGTAFGEPIYARIKTDDTDHADYVVKRLATMMGNFIATTPEEIQLDGKLYLVVFKEQL